MPQVTVPEMMTQGSVPVPDPTEKTTQQLLREIGLVKDIIEATIEGKDLVNKEKFESIAKQFELNDKALLAALKAAQDAVFAQQLANTAANTKMEAGFTKQIDASGELLNQVRSALESKHEDLKTRVTAIEAIKVGVTETKASQGATIGMAIAGSVLIVGILEVILRFIK
jgi:hypothetical protein